MGRSNASFYKNAIVAKYDGRCPYPLCMGSEDPQGDMAKNFIYGGYDMIARGPLGWGHAACVNSKIHKHESGGHQVCHSSRGGWVRVTDDWDLVDCKKCLKKRPTEEAE